MNGFPRSVLWKSLGGVLLWGFVVSWLAFDYANRMWQADHYRFFPLLIVAVPGLLWLRRDDLLDEATPATARICSVGFSVALLLVLAGHLLSSNFLGVLGTIAAAVTLLYWRVGWGGIKAALPVLMLLVFVVPLPLGFDQQAVVKLQSLASGLGSRMLDGLGFVHFRQGMILVTEQSQFAAEEACRNARFCFSAPALVATYCVWACYPWWRALVALLVTIAWVIVGNALRVASVVVLAEKVSQAFAFGWRHELLSLAIFALVILLVASTDAVVALLARSELGIDPQASTNLFTSSEDDDEDDLEDESWAQESEPADKRPAQVARSKQFLTQTPKLIWLASGCLLVGLVGLRVAYVRATDDATVVPATATELADLKAADLPASIGSWDRDDFQVIERESRGMLAENSFVWKYRSDNAAALISVERPVTGWQNLMVVFQAMGWNGTAEYGLSEVSSEWSFSRLSLERADGLEGLVWYSIFNRDGSQVQPPSRYRAKGVRQWLSVLAERISHSLGLQKETSRANDTAASVIQLFSECGDCTERQIKELEELYVKARRMLLQKN